MNEEAILRDTLEIHKENILKLERKIAEYGSLAPIFLENQLERENDAVKEIEARLDVLGKVEAVPVIEIKKTMSPDRVPRLEEKFDAMFQAVTRIEAKIDIHSSKLTAHDEKLIELESYHEQTNISPTIIKMITISLVIVSIMLAVSLFAPQFHG